MSSASDPVRAVPALLVAALAWGLPAGARDAQGIYAIRGIGTTPCAEVSRMVAEEAPQLVALVAWSDGALSQINRSRAEVYDLMPFVDPPGIFATLVVNFCAGQPELSYAEAVEAVADLLMPIAVSRQAQPVTLTHEENQARIYTETLRAVIAKLGQLGFLNTGQVATVESVRGAVLDYQAARGLPATGVPDAATVLPLMLDE